MQKTAAWPGLTSTRTKAKICPANENLNRVRILGLLTRYDIAAKPRREDLI